MRIGVLGGGKEKEKQKSGLKRRHGKEKEKARQASGLKRSHGKEKEK